MRVIVIKFWSPVLWFINNNLIIMEKLTPNMKADQDLLTTLPMWICLQGLSFNLWGNRVISALVNTIGVLVKLHEGTKKEKSRISFARVLVEVLTEIGLPNIVEAVDQEGNVHNHDVIYENPPLRCDKFVVLGIWFTNAE